MPTTMSPVSELVSLRGGLAVPVAALRVLWALEEREFNIWLTDTGGLRVAPGSRLTSDDRAAIAQHRDALCALVAHCDSPAVDLVT